MRKDKKSYQFESDQYLLSPSWEAWADWDVVTSLREKQMYFDSKIGNIYKDWHLHHEDIDKFEAMAYKRRNQKPWFVLSAPYMLVSVQITKLHYNLTLLNIGEGRTMILPHKRSNWWYASLVLKV